jgi:predicted glycosyltransferase
VVFRPIAERLRAAGHEVEVTARDYAQTLALARRLGVQHRAIGTHGGAKRSRKLISLVSRSIELFRWARGRRFDLAAAHGSNDLAVVAKVLGIPAVDMFDYEWATLQHNVGCRPARRVMTPDTIPPARLRRYGVTEEKLAQFPGLKEDYYLADFEPDRGVLEELGVDSSRVLVAVRPPPDVSLYHRKANRLFPQVLDHIGRDPQVHAVVLPRTEQQRRFLQWLALPSLIVPDHAVDGQSLVALVDLVVSAGGTMNREAVALGTPVYTTYGGRLGGVDEALIREGRLRPLSDPRAIELVKRNGPPTVSRRDPQLLVELMLGGAA